MTKGPHIEELDQLKLNELIKRVERAIAHDLALSVEDMKLLLAAIVTLCSLQEKMQEHDVTLHKMRKLLGMVRQSESRRSNESTNKNSHTNNRNRNRKNNPNKKTMPVVHHKMTQYHSGQQCPDCGHGKLYRYSPGKLLRITGHAPYEATQHITEQLRCNACLEIYKAPLPEEVLADGHANQMYGYSARALMAVHKFYSGLAYYHQENLTDILGCSISATTIYDQCEYVANAITPVFHQMQRLAADAPRFLLDDTHNRILSQQPELREKRHGKGKQLRTGIYSSGLIALTEEGHEIILFETSLGHAGEHLDKILKKRTVGLPPPITMSDALSSNTSVIIPVIRSYCNAHARRQFYDLATQHPDEIEWVLDTYGMIWKNEKDIKEQGFDPQKRLEYHQAHSLTVMEKLKDWAVNKQNADDFETHSALGKAINYFLRHYEPLTLFCAKTGALIDNNRMEERLKIVIRGRKTSHFYKTPIGAGVANFLISTIATADSVGENVYEYLLALQKNQAAVKKNPELWLPWNYQKQLKQLDVEKLGPNKMAA